MRIEKFIEFLQGVKSDLSSKDIFHIEAEEKEGRVCAMFRFGPAAMTYEYVEIDTDS